MDLEKLLRQRKSAIVARWFDAVIATYPPDTAKFLKSQRDRFANPVGDAIATGVEGLFDQFLEGIDPEQTHPFLDRIVRIRAVQELTPSRALAFVFLLKGVVREALEPELRGGGHAEELAAIDARIDTLALLAFDIFMQCREQIYKIKADEIRRLTHNLLRRAKMIIDIPEEPSDAKNDHAT